MGFIESVAGKVLHQIKNVAGYPCIDAPLNRSFKENAPLLVHLLRIFFTHRTTQHIGRPKRIAGKLLSDPHNLFLIENHTISSSENGFEPWVRVSNDFPTLLPINEVIHHS